MAVSDRLQATFGYSAPPEALFYQFTFALRFELSLGGAPVTQFLRALDRSRAVVRAAFPRVEDIDIVFLSHAPEPLTRENARALRALRKVGFRPRLRSFERRPLAPEDEKFWRLEGERPPYPFLFEARAGATMDDIDALIWSSCAVDQEIRPYAPFLIYLIDYSRGIAVHIYDDRGMDVIATSREAIAGLYRQFGDWLLDYDRARMDATFAD